jgi:alpha-L-fucosidase
MSASVPTAITLPPEKRWFTHERFGLFIHWGLYSLHGQGEWNISRKEGRFDEYQKYFDHFDPDQFDPRDWARRARAAGMRYSIITAKHHDGFCLWDTKHTDWKVTKTPFGRDIIREWTDAFRAEGLRVGLYYSLIDWRHADFTIDIFHPQRNAENVAELNAQRDMGRYRDYMKAQVRELLTDYGRIDDMFFDFGYAKQSYRGLPGKGPADWDSEGLTALTKSLQPDILINNRLGLLDRLADYYTPERFVPESPPTRDGRPAPWCAAFTSSETWGYTRDDQVWKSTHQLIQILVSMVSMGGNLLMNMGPNGRGALEPRAKEALQGYADWMALHSRAIYGCGHSAYKAPADCRFTQNGRRLYLHMFNWPFLHLHVPGLGGKVEYAQLLNDASEIRILRRGEHIAGDGEGLQGLDRKPIPDDTLTLILPPRKPPVEVPVIELFLKE